MNPAPEYTAPLVGECGRDEPHALEHPVTQ
jgi:hypothetical protein